MIAIIRRCLDTSRRGCHVRRLAVLTAMLATGCGGDSSPTIVAPPVVLAVVCTTEQIALCTAPETAARVGVAIEDASLRSLQSLTDVSRRRELEMSLTAIRAALAAKNITSLRTATTASASSLGTAIASGGADAPELTSIQLAVLQAQRLLDPQT